MNRTRKTRNWATALLAVLLMGGTGSVRAAGDVRKMSFDDVEIGTFVKFVGEITGKRFVVADDITGKITVVAPAVPSENVFPLAVSVLEGAGCSVVEEDGLYRVTRLPEGGSPTAPVFSAGQPLPTAGMATRIFRLKNVPASSVRKLLEGLYQRGKTTMIGSMDETNHLLVTDTVRGLARIERIVLDIDQPGLARTMEVVPLRFAGAEELAQQLNAAMSEQANRAEVLRQRLNPVAGGVDQQMRGAPVVVASPHANSLILVGGGEQLIQLKSLIAQMDVDMPHGRTRLNAIFLKYLAAEEAAKSLSELLAKSPLNEKEGGPRRYRIAIQASEANNALLVDAAPGDFEAVKRLVDQLDQKPEQVHIDVAILELSVDDAMSVGVEITALDSPAMIGETVVQGGLRLNEGVGSIMNSVTEGMFPRGLTVGVAHGNANDSGGLSVGYPGAINIDALKRDGRYELVSKTSLTAQNNEEASFNIVEEIPILKSTIQGGSGSARDVIQNIERVEVGIKLKLTPHIVPEGEVRMELNPSIEAVIESGSSVENAQFTPTIARREASTTVSVPNGQTVVIAGLTREDKTEVVRKIPLLGSLPLVGWLFRSTTDANEKTELMILVTPTISGAATNETAVMAEWGRRLEAAENDE